jgi:hypothetical protein
MEKEQSGKKITESDALQNAGNSHRREVKFGNEAEQNSQGKDNGASLEDLNIDPGLSGASPDSSRQGQRDRDPDDKQKKGENKVSGRPAVPDGVTERRVNILPASRIIYQDHPGYGDTSKSIQRGETLSGQIESP